MPLVFKDPQARFLQNPFARVFAQRNAAAVNGLIAVATPQMILENGKACFRSITTVF
jgi:hypothetical protein